MAAVAQRYARQQAITGWDQQRLATAALVVAGQGLLAGLTALLAAAMGFGRIVLVGRPQTSPNRRSFRRQLTTSGPALGSLLNRVNPDVTVTSTSRRLSPALAKAMAGASALVVAGGDVGAWTRARRVADAVSTPVLAGHAAGRTIAWGVPDRDVTFRAGARMEPAVGSLIAAALLVEGARRAVLALPGEEPWQGVSTWNLGRVPVAPAPAQPRRTVQLVGAGALANWYALSLGLLGGDWDLTIYDEDTIETTNLNRQVAFYDAVGDLKGPALARRLQQWFPSLRARGLGMHVTDDRRFHPRHSDVLVSCPDNFEVRALLNRMARLSGVPLVNGGTRADGGSCQTYLRGATPCLSCLFGVDELSAQERRREGCLQAEASVVTSNAIVGALMAWTTAQLAGGRSVPAGTLAYDGSAARDCVGVHSVREGCGCG